MSSTRDVIVVAAALAGAVAVLAAVGGTGSVAARLVRDYEAGRPEAATQAQALLDSQGRRFLGVEEEGRLRGVVDRHLRSQALAAARPETIKARYMLGVPPPDEAAAEDPATLPALRPVLAKWGWAGAAGAPAAWCTATAKLAFFRDGWIWVTDPKGQVLKSLWYEPDLEAAGRLRWSHDGSTLWIRADGWRRWLGLEMLLK